MTYIELQVALAEIWPLLAAMLGNRLNGLETALLPLLRTLEQSPEDPDRVNAVLELLERDYPDVYELLLEAAAAESIKVEQSALPEKASTGEIAQGGWSFRGTSLAVRSSLGRYMVVPVWYATDRQNTGSTDPADRYSGDRGELGFGRLEVSIPDRHEKGALEKPRWFRLEFRKDPEKHVVLLGANEMGKDDWKAELRQKVGECSRHDLLLFIHGYNVGFETAAQRAAQFAYDLEFQGLVVLYSWPSEGRLLRYPVDEDNAQWTVDHFEEVLQLLLSSVGADCLHAVAHSMGSRVLAEGIRRFDPAALPAGSATLREVVFAAPDINADTFRNFVDKFYGRAGRITLYASESDKALEGSRKVHKYPRAGDARNGLVLSSRLETIDASAVDQAFLGHSYFCENPSVLGDMFSLIMEGLSAASPRAGLEARERAGARYWVLARCNSAVASG